MHFLKIDKMDPYVAGEHLFTAVICSKLYLDVFRLFCEVLEFVPDLQNCFTTSEVGKIDTFLPEIDFQVTFGRVGT